jgi:long-chain acyl-CoA synthetase
LIFKDQNISYQTLKNASDRLASGLKKKGLNPGDRIAIMLPNVPHFCISFFALLQIGVTIVPISIFCKAEEIHHQLEDSEVKGIVYWEGFRESVHQAAQGLEQCNLLMVLSDHTTPGETRLNYLIEIHDPLQDIEDVDKDNTAMIVYTAGTSGYPKGAELTHHNLLFDIDACVSFLNLESEDSVAGVLPLYHPLGQSLVMGSFFRVGGKVVLIPKFNPEIVLHTIEEQNISYFVGVPSMFRELLKVEEKKLNLGSLKYCLSSGDALKPETVTSFEERFKIPILEGYGLTEASPMVSFNSPTRERRPGSIGLPLRGIEMNIVDEQSKEVKPGQVGEILVKGPNVMKGYLNRPEATKEVLKDGWLHTGDFAELHENGLAFIVARKKNVIIKSGFNVYPREVEKFLAGHPKVSETVVIGIPDSLLGEEIIAGVILRENETAKQDEIIEYMKERLAAYKCPKEIHFFDTFPRGSTGRILRDKVKDMILNKDV